MQCKCHVTVTEAEPKCIDSEIAFVALLGLGPWLMHADFHIVSLSYTGQLLIASIILSNVDLDIRSQDQYLKE